MRILIRTGHFLGHGGDFVQIAAGGGHKARPEQMPVGYGPFLIIRQNQDNSGIMH